ncbi:MAG: hypothetical protein R3D00_11870 [Bacteroidia bacterium]
MRNLILPIFCILFTAVTGCNSIRYSSHDQYAAYRGDSRNEMSPIQTNQSGKVQIALILDTSWSMETVLEYTKGTFWIFVDEILRQNDQYYTPELEFALYEYGNPTLKRKTQFIRQVVPFTSDLDKISEELYYLSVNHSIRGKSFSGAALLRATDELNWSEKPGDQKMMIIAGNENFRKGPVDYQRAIALARRKGIIVNTVFAGDYRKGIQLWWQDAAFLGNGMYRNVETSIPLEKYYYPTVFDAQICYFNTQLNYTYLPYGSQGNYSWNRCLEQDKFALRFGEAYESIRALAKCRPGYRVPGWDLIDAIDTRQIKLEEIAEADLPEVLKNISREEQLAYLERMRKSRDEIKLRILGLQVQKEAEIRKQGRGIYGITEIPFQAVVKNIRPAETFPGTKGKQFDSPSPREINRPEIPQQPIPPAIRQQEIREQSPQIQSETEVRLQVENQSREQEIMQRADLEKRQQEARDRAAQIQREAEVRRQAEIQSDEQQEARQRAEQAQREQEARQRTEQAQREQEARQRTEQAQREQEARQRTEQAQREQEARQRAEQAQREQEARQRAEQAQREQEARQRAEQAQREQEARQRAEQAQREQEARQRAEQAQREQEAARQRAEQARQMQIQNNNTGIKIE